MEEAGFIPGDCNGGFTNPPIDRARYERTPDKDMSWCAKLVRFALLVVISTIIATKVVPQIAKKIVTKIITMIAKIISMKIVKKITKIARNTEVKYILWIARTVVTIFPRIDVFPWPVIAVVRVG